MRRRKLSKLAKKKLDPISSYWRNKADRAWGRLVAERDKVCVVCGSDSFCQPHHLIANSVHCLRHQVPNGILLCAWHHKFDPRFSAHRGSALFGEWLVRSRPEQVKWLQDHQGDDFPPNYREAMERLSGE